jgi:Domain of unknown function (DUF4345)
MAKTLRWLLWLMGVACVAIGLAHLVLGVASVPGEGSASATVDSRERFYGAIFVGFGLAWCWAAHRSPVPATLVRWLAGIFMLGGIGRVLSLVVHGRPNWFQEILTAVELVLPPLYYRLAAADENAHGRTSSPATPLPGRAGD